MSFWILPIVGWPTRILKQWGPECAQHGTQAPESCSNPSDPLSPGQFRPWDFWSSPWVPQFVSSILQKYNSCLSTHQPYDCAIEPNLDPRLLKEDYSFSHLETWAMEEYIQEALKNGLIWPSTSPAAAPFFFVGKKDGGFCQCIY